MLNGLLLNAFVFNMEYLILILATYRLSFLFANEYGIFELVYKFRRYLGVRADDYGELYGTNELSKMIICMYCNSIWLGVAMAIGYVLIPNFVLFMLPFALSGAIVAVQEI